MKKDLIIVGAGGFGLEALSLAESINRIESRWNIRGFLSDVPDVLEGRDCDYGIIGTIQDWQPSENEVFAIGISSPAGKQKVVGLLKSRGAEFVTLVNPRTVIPRHVQLGEGCIVTMGWISDYANIGNFVHIAGSMVGNATIGDYCTTTGFANLTDAILGKRVFVGSHAVILNKRHIGDDAFICAGSIVFNNVKPGIKVLGNPAKKVDF